MNVEETGRELVWRNGTVLRNTSMDYRRLLSPCSIPLPGL
jgi:hypothetical protein